VLFNATLVRVETSEFIAGLILKLTFGHDDG
jgi:hypothetical protein